MGGMDIPLPPRVPTYVLLGWPLGHSLSPGIHEAAFREAGVPGTYKCLPVSTSGLPDVLADLRAGRWAGANVTIPHKMTVRSWVDEESELVMAVGAVNTIVRTTAGLRGENTDVAGFAHALAVAGATDGRGRRAVVLGAGGGARAVCWALLAAGYAVTVLARSVARASVLAATLQRARSAIEDGSASPGPAQLGSRAVAAERDPNRVGPLMTTGHLDSVNLVARAATADLLVNATPIGAAPEADACPWPADQTIPARLTVIDLVAWPPETRLVTLARADGARSHGGLEMLLAQAAASFALWTGQAPPLEAMRAAALAGRQDGC